MYNTREKASYLTKHREIVHQTQKEMFHLTSKQQTLIHQTRGVFQLRSKHREVIHQTRERVFQLRSKNRERGYKNDTHTGSLTDFVMPGVLSNLNFFLKKIQTNVCQIFCQLCLASQPISKMVIPIVLCSNVVPRVRILVPVKRYGAVLSYANEFLVHI